MSAPIEHGTAASTRNDIILVDSGRLSREALQRLLESLSFAVVGGGRTLAEALQEAGADTSPALIVHNFHSDDEPEQRLSQIEEARARFEEAKSVVLTGNLSIDLLLRTARTGAEAILSKDISADILRRALELVLLGHRLFPSELTGMLAEAGAEAIQRQPEPPRGPPSRSAPALSPRERQILQCLVDGLPNKLIARRLDITEATVKVHIKALLRKTQMANRTQAAIWALNNNLQCEPDLADALTEAPTIPADGHLTPPGAVNGDGSARVPPILGGGSTAVVIPRQRN